MKKDGLETKKTKREKGAKLRFLLPFLPFLSFLFPLCISVKEVNTSRHQAQTTNPAIVYGSISGRVMSEDGPVPFANVTISPASGRELVHSLDHNSCCNTHQYEEDSGESSAARSKGNIHGCRAQRLQS